MRCKEKEERGADVEGADKEEERRWSDAEREQEA